MNTTYILILTGAVLLTAAVVALICRLRMNKRELECAEWKMKAEHAAQQLADARADYDKRLLQVRDEARLNTDKALAAQKALFEESLRNMRSTVQATTEAMLKERQEDFRKSSSESLDTILRPLQAKMEEMRKAVSENSSTQSELKGAMNAKIAELVSQTAKTAHSADELTMALKNSNKTQGDRGEQQLTNLLSSFGFVEGRQILTQEFIKDKYGNYIKDGKGERMRPDVLLRLDESRVIIIDSKMVLKAYLDYIHAREIGDEAAMQLAIEENLRAVENQVELLAKQSYDAYMQEPYTTLNYVVMYVPMAGALQLAIANKPNLWRAAMEKHVLIADENTLYAMLRTIEITWVKIDQARNHQKIIDAASTMLERVELLLAHFVEAEKSIRQASDSIADCKQQLTQGGKSIVTAASELKKYGVVPKETGERKKRLPKIAPLIEASGDTLDDATLTSGEE